METKYALKYLSSLLTNTEIKNNPFDLNQKYFISNNSKYFQYNTKNGLLIFDNRLRHTLKNSYKVDSDDFLIKIMNEFFKEKRINFYIRSIYVIDFSMFYG
jgi:CTP:phosphocholine cytidylyltransferase-like protein